MTRKTAQQVVFWLCVVLGSPIWLALAVVVLVFYILWVVCALPFALVEWSIGGDDILLNDHPVYLLLDWLFPEKQ